MARIFRQGDIILEEVEKLPDGVVLDSREFVAIGETGHQHKIQADVYTPLIEIPTIEVKEWPKKEDTWLIVKDDQIMTHEEHPLLNVPKGIYKLRRVRSFTPKREMPAWD